MSDRKSKPSAERTTELQSKLYQAAKSDPTRRFHTLFDKLYLPYILQSAWEQVAKNRGAAGIDQYAGKIASRPVCSSWSGRITMPSAQICGETADRRVASATNFGMSFSSKKCSSKMGTIGKSSRASVVFSSEKSRYA